MGEILSSFELIDAKSLEVVTDYFKLKSPVGPHPFYILIETQGSNTLHDEEKLNAFLENVMDQKIVLDGTTTNEPGKMRVDSFISFLSLSPLFFIMKHSRGISAINKFRNHCKNYYNNLCILM